MISPLVDKTILTPLHHGGPGSNGTISRLVLHGTVSPCVPGGADNNAYYFQSATAGGAAHYIGDPAAVVCAVDEDCKASHAPPNVGSIGFEFCDPQTGPAERWQDAAHQAMLHKAAPVCADICARHNLPIVWLEVADLVAGKSGITSHANVAKAWHQSDHSDPGPDFPVDQFLALLTPSKPSEDTVNFHFAQHKGHPDVYLVNLATPPKHVTLFADAEYWAHQEGHTISGGTDKLGADGNGDIRDGLLLDDKGAALFGITS